MKAHQLISLGCKKYGDFKKPSCAGIEPDRRVFLYSAMHCSTASLTITLGCSSFPAITVVDIDSINVIVKSRLIIVFFKK